jgi:hypothetical protein
MLAALPCQRVYKLAEEKLKGISADIVAMKRTEQYLKRVLSDWEHRCSERLPDRNRICCTRLPGILVVPIERQINFGGGKRENLNRFVSILRAASGSTGHAVLPHAHEQMKAAQQRADVGKNGDQAFGSARACQRCWEPFGPPWSGIAGAGPRRH